MPSVIHEDMVQTYLDAGYRRDKIRPWLYAAYVYNRYKPAQKKLWMLYENGKEFKSRKWLMGKGLQLEQIEKNEQEWGNDDLYKFGKWELNEEPLSMIENAGLPDAWNIRMDEDGDFCFTWVECSLHNRISPHKLYMIAWLRDLLHDSFVELELITVQQEDGAQGVVHPDLWACCSFPLDDADALKRRVANYWWSIPRLTRPGQFPPHEVECAANRNQDFERTHAGF